MPRKVVATAPGKCILFGEHSVVYSQPAVAASLSSSLVQCTVTQGGPGGVLRVTLGDFDVSFACPLESLPPASMDGSVPQSSPDLSSLLSRVPKSTRRVLAPVLSLVSALVLSRARSIHVTVLSLSLPVGSGLGSSAAALVSISASLLRLRFGSWWSADLCNEFAFWAELTLAKVSGIDNTVCCHGGVWEYTKKGGFERVPSGAYQLEVLIVWTKVGKDTKRQVDGELRKHVFSNLIDDA